MLSLVSLLRMRDQALTKLAKSPTAAMIIIVPLATAGGSKNRCQASQIMNPAITNRVTPLNNAAIISNR
ncbi:hypothetical protein D3C75_645160 [compost metagenome]